MDKCKYIETIRSKYKHGLYIYGAGDYACGLYNLLTRESIHVDGFLVTSLKNNPQRLFDLEVLDINNFQNINNTLVVIGVKTEHNEEIIKTLKAHDFTNYIAAPDNLPFFIDELNRYERPILEITPKIGCSVNCMFCPQDILVKKYRACTNKLSMTLSEFKKCIDKTPKDLMIDFSGFVEPFLNKESIDMIEYAAEIGRDISLYTTMVGVDEEILERLLKINFYRVVLHLPDVNGYANIPITEKYLNIIKIASFSNMPNGKPFIYLGSSQAEPHPDVVKAISGKFAINYELQDRAGSLDDLCLNKACRKEGRIYCLRAKHMNHFVLLPNGDLALCCNDFGLNHIIGNLINDDWRSIINGDIMNQVYKCMDNSDYGEIICRVCIYSENY